MTVATSSPLTSTPPGGEGGPYHQTVGKHCTTFHHLTARQSTLARRQPEPSRSHQNRPAFTDSSIKLNGRKHPARHSCSEQRAAKQPLQRLFTRAGEGKRPLALNIKNSLYNRGKIFKQLSALVSILSYPGMNLNSRYNNNLT